MKSIIPFVIPALILAIANIAIAEEWWQHAVIYQIYPRSFKDSDDSGTGDLQGIISKLDHLADINVDAIWLSPIFTSPQVDAGYDVSDYRDIDPIYGTMEDFEELVEKATALGIKVILDLVPNHSSDQHQWFLDSVQKKKPYDDYYVWMDGKNNDDQVPPTNWVSVFGGLAWTYHPERKQWYLHQFTKEQPDLNFRNEAVQEEFKEIIKFWLDKGVYGFRVDAVRHMFEVFDDEPLSHQTDNAFDYGYLDHVYTTDQNETYHVMYDWRELMDQYVADNGGDQRIFMTESYTSIKEVMKYYEGDGRIGAHFPFNFDLVSDLNEDVDARDVVALINNWFAYMPHGYTANWVLGNHDNHRIATRVGPELANCMNMLTAILPGVMVTYNGEEIGMENGEVTFIEGDDPSGCAVGEDEFENVSRDFERTPFHWDGTKNAGFSDADKTWLPVSQKYLTNNLALQKEQDADAGTYYHTYKALTKLRRDSKALKSGSLNAFAPSHNSLLAFRKYKEEMVVFACHLGRNDEDEVINLDSFGIEFDKSSTKFNVVASNNPKGIGPMTATDNTITLKKYDAFVMDMSGAGYYQVSMMMIMFSSLVYYIF